MCSWGSASTLCSVLTTCVHTHKCTQKNTPRNPYNFLLCIYCMFKTCWIISVLFSTKGCLFNNFISFCSNNPHVFLLTMYQNLNTHPTRTNNMMTLHFLKLCLHEGSKAPAIWQPHLCTLGKISNHEMF